MLFNYKEHRIFAFSDSHGMHKRLHIPEEADILLCAGDVVSGFGKDGMENFFSWLLPGPSPMSITGEVRSPTPNTTLCRVSHRAHFRHSMQLCSNSFQSIMFCVLQSLPQRLRRILFRVGNDPIQQPPLLCADFRAPVSHCGQIAAFQCQLIQFIALA